MNFFDSFKRFLLGTPREQESYNQQRDSDRRLDRFWRDGQTPDHFFRDDDDSVTFSIFANPLEMHRYFEQQMNDFMKMFSMDEQGPFGPPGGFPFSDMGPFNFPPIDGHGQPVDQQSSDPNNLRDQFLKPGYSKPETRDRRFPRGNLPHEKCDSDIDERFNTGDLDLLLKENDPDNRQLNKQPNIQFFGKSVQYKTIRHPDGRVESTKIVRDNDGNEEKVVTRKFADKEHTVITRRDKEGREEIEENMLNLESNDLDGFWKRGQPTVNSIQEQPHNWFPFDRYFK